jgi:hypothetical protein
MQARIDAKIAAEEAAGKEGAESVPAMKHRQPTPKTMAEAEVKIGDVSERYAAEVGPRWRKPAVWISPATRRSVKRL